MQHLSSPAGVKKRGTKKGTRSGKRGTRQRRERTKKGLEEHKLPTKEKDQGDSTRNKRSQGGCLAEKQTRKTNRTKAYTDNPVENHGEEQNSMRDRGRETVKGGNRVATANRGGRLG